MIPVIEIGGFVAGGFLYTMSGENPKKKWINTLELRMIGMLA